MNINVLSMVVSLLYIILIAVFYFIRKKVKSAETNIYSIILVVTIVAIVLDLAGIYVSSIGLYDTMLRELISKFFHTSIITIMFLMTLYLFFHNNGKQKKYKYFSVISYLSLIFVNFMLPIVHFKEGNIIYGSGPNLTFLYVTSVLFLVTWIFFIIMHWGKLNNKKLTPMLFLLIFAIPVILIQMFNPELLLISTLMSISAFLMYHTIENPDVKTIEKLTYANDQIEKANRAKTDFLSNMSHEIRTPLNAIIGFAHCIKDEDNMSTIKDEATDIINASETLLEIVNGVLDISKIEANKMEIIESEYDLVSEMEKICKLVIPRLGKKDIDFKYNFARDLPGRLYGDISKMRQIITNLLTNAVKYTNSGTINFDISSINQNGVASLVFVIQDTGRGIKNEQINKLFTKFNRLDEDKNSTIEGTGLGLAITKSLVDLMGGKILVHSVYEQGSKFTVYIRQKIISMDKISLEDKSIDRHVDFVGYKVLLVDDNRLNIKIAEKLLERYGIKPTSVISGVECVDKVKTEKWDLILLDDMMPNMSGKETLVKLKELDEFSTPVVALTANVLSGNDTKYKSLGFDDYLGKPIDASELVRVLRTYYPGVEKVVAKKRVLLVDDNPVNNKITKKILSNYDVDVEVVNSGIDCLNKIYKNNSMFDLIFMDDMMPNMSGVETFEKLKNDPNFKTPVVVLTANAIEGSREFYISKGFSDYIAKPIDMSHFKEVIKDILGE